MTSVDILALQRVVAGTVWRSAVLAGVNVHYTVDLDGGGRGFGQRVVPIVRDMTGPRHSVLEFCAGPGFIGFSLLGHGLCESLSLADVNPKAVEACRRTVEVNRLHDRVTVHLSDSLDGVPENRRFDLVVGNPPHFNPRLLEPGWQGGAPELITLDPDWRLHQRFFSTVGRYLEPGGSVLLFEDRRSGGLPEFCTMAEANGLHVSGILLPRFPDSTTAADLDRQERIESEPLDLDVETTPDAALAGAPSTDLRDVVYVLWVTRNGGR